MGLLDTIKNSSIFKSLHKKAKQSGVKLSTQTKKKPEKDSLVSLYKKNKDNILNIGKNIGGNKGKVIKDIITTPIKGPTITDVEKGSEILGNKLTKYGDKVRKKGPYEKKLVGSTISAIGDTISIPSEAIKNTKRIKKLVDTGKISLAEGIIEGASSDALAGLSLIAAPIITGINTVMKATGVDKNLGKATEFVNNGLVNYGVNHLGLTEEKAKSRINSAMNVIRGGTMFRGMRTISGKSSKGLLSNKIKSKKGKKITNTIQGGLEISSPDLAVLVAAEMAKKEGKDLPNTKEFVKSFAVTSGIGLGMGKGGKTTKGRPRQSKVTTNLNGKVQVVKDETLELKTTKGRPRQSKVTKPSVKVKEIPKTKTNLELEKNITKTKPNNSQQLTLKLSDKLKETPKTKKEVKLSPKVKPSLETTSDGSKQWINVNENKIGQIIKEAGPNKIKLEPTFSEKIKQKVIKFNKGVDRRAKRSVNNLNMLQEAKADGTLVKDDNLMDTKKSLTEKGKEYNVLKDGKTDKGRKTALYTDKGKALGGKGKGVHLEKVEKPKLSDKVKNKKLTKKDIENLWGEEGKVKLDTKGHIETLDGKAVYLDKTTSKTSKGGQDILLEGVKQVLSEGISGVLNNIKIIDKNGNKITLQTVIDGIKNYAQNNFKNDLFNKFKINKLQEIEKNNTKGINEGFDFINKNLDDLLPNEKGQPVDYIRENIKNTGSEIYDTNSRIRNNNSGKVRAVLNYVYGNAKLLEKELSEGTKKKISEQQKKQIFNSVVKELPIETQKFVKQIDGYKKVMEVIFDKIGQQLEQEGYIAHAKQGYTRGTILKDIFNKYKNASGKEAAKLKKEFGEKTLEDIQAELNGEKKMTEKELASILKKSKDVWYLHSNNPLDIITDYVNNITKLKERKDIIETIKEVSQKDKEVGNYLANVLSKGDNFIYNKLLDIHPTKGKVEKGAKNTAKGLSIATYLGNTGLLLQNLTFGLSQLVGQGIKNTALGKFKLSGKNEISDVRQYLVDNKLSSHKGYDPNSNFKSNTKLSTKIKSGAKAGLDKGMRFFTATLVPQMQAILASGYMQKYIKKNGGLRKGESIVNGFERILKNKSEQENLLVRGDLSKQVKAIEDSSYTAGATNKWLDVPLFSMIKTWSRGNLDNITTAVKDTVDLASKQKKGSKSFEVDMGGKKVRIAENATDFTSRIITIALVAELLANQFETEAEKEEVKKKVFASSVQEYLKNLITNPIGIAGVDILTSTLLNTIKNTTKIINADNNEDRKKYIEDTFFDIMTGLRTGKNTIDQIKSTIYGTERQRHTSPNGGYTYTDEKPTSVIGYFAQVNPGKSGYSHFYELEKKIKDKLPKDFATYLGNFVNSSRTLRNITQASNGIGNAKAQAEVKNIINRIKNIENEKLTITEWLDKVIPTKGDKRKLSQKIKIGEYIPKDQKTIDKQLNKLSLIFKGIDKNYINIFRNTKDFNTKLNEIKIKNPKLYSTFMKRVLSTYDDNTTTGTTKQNAFIDNLINKELNGALLNTVIKGRIQQLNNEILKAKGDKEQITIGDKEKLEQLNKSLELLDTIPTLKKQIFDSLTELATIPNKKDIDKYRELLADYPELQDLYLRAAELRGGKLNRDKQSTENSTEKITEDYNLKSTGIGQKIKLSNLIPTKKIKLGKVIDNGQQINNPEVKFSKLSEMIKK